MNMRVYNIINFEKNTIYKLPEKVVMDRMIGPVPTKAEKKLIQIKQKQILPKVVIKENLQPINEQVSPHIRQSETAY